MWIALAGELGEADAVVLAPESEGVGEGGGDASDWIAVACFSWDVVEAADWVDFFKVCGWGDHAGLDGFEAGDELDGSGGLDEVSEHGLDRGEGNFHRVVFED